MSFFALMKTQSNKKIIMKIKTEKIENKKLNKKYIIVYQNYNNNDNSDQKLVQIELATT